MQKFNITCLFICSLFFGLNAQCPSGDVNLGTQAQVDQFVADYPTCMTIEGNLTIGLLAGTSAIDDISGLINITSVSGNVLVRGNFGLTSINGLGGLTTVGGDLTFDTNVNIPNLDALSNLITVGGNFTIDFISDITNVAGLSSLDSVGGFLTLRDNRDLADLSGLDNLESVGGITIRGNDELESIPGFSGLQAAASGVFIFGNDLLLDVAGFNNLTIAGNLSISGNTLLNDISGFSNLDTVSTDMSLNGNDVLVDITGFPNLRVVGRFLEIQSNDALLSVSGFPLLERTGAFLLEENTVLTNISGFNALTTIEGATGWCYIEDNPALVDLSGLANVGSINRMIIRNNDALPNLAGFAGLTTVVEFIDIIDNALLTDLGGLNSLTTILGDIRVENNPAFTTFSGTPSLSSARFIGFFDNPVLTDLSGLSDIAELNGLRFERNNSLTDIGGMDQVTTMSSSIIIAENAALQSISGLNNLTSIGGELTISDNDALTDVSGLSSLTSVTREIWVILNENLSDFTGWSNLSNTGDDFYIASNPGLTSLNGLEGLNFVGGRLWLENNAALSDISALADVSTVGDYLAIDNCDQLTDLNGLQDLTSVGSFVRISGNDNLTSLTGLNNLVNSSGLNISSNPVLTSLSGLESLTAINGSLRIANNALLTSLEDLAGVNLSLNSGLTIQNNPNLAVCGLPNICTYLENTTSTQITISGNASGCATRADIEMQCNDPCPPFVFTFETQADVNAYVANYSDCSVFAGDLVIGATTANDISNLSGLSFITAIDGTLVIRNTNLQSLSGLQNIDASTITDLAIENNPNLSVCALANFCAYLGIETNTATISGNQANCASREEVSIACDQDCPDGTVFLRSQGQVDEYVSLYGECEVITGSLLFATLSGNDVSDITDISGLSNLRTIEGRLHIASTSLVNLSGLEGLTTINGDLIIERNAALTELTALSNVTTIDGRLWIRVNEALVSLGGLQNIDAEGITDLRLFMNDNLTTCAIASVCAYFNIPMNNVNIGSNATGCSTQEEVETQCAIALPGDLCADAVDVNPLLGQGLDVPQTTVLLDNSLYTAAGNPNDGFECFAAVGGSISNSIWYQFTGDGNDYNLTTVQCTATDYIDGGDTQMALYQGDCDNLTAVACNENADSEVPQLNSQLTFTTEPGVDYYLLVDGNDVTGEFCLEVTQVMITNTSTPAPTTIQLFPNPTTGQLQLGNIAAKEVIIFNPQGSLVATYANPGHSLDLSLLPAGLYYLQLTTATEHYVARIVKVD